MSQESILETSSTYKCPHCQKMKKYKMNLQKHILLCENRKTNKKFIDSNNRDNIEHTTIDELLFIITRQDEQIQRMSKQITQINQILNRQERKNICDYLNKIIPVGQYIPFSEWISKIDITFPFILSMCRYNIQDSLLESFKQYYDETTANYPFPMKAFVENKSKIYLYDINPNLETKWISVQNEPFIQIVNDIYKKWKKTFAKWMFENQAEFDMNIDMNEMKQAYMNKMDRYNKLTDKEKTTKIRQWIIQKIETTMPQMVMISV